MRNAETLTSSETAALPYAIPVKIYDNGGRSMDRYTVVDMRPEAIWRYCGQDKRVALSLSDDQSPRGVCLSDYAVAGPHLGRRIPFDGLPAQCQRQVRSWLDDSAYWEVDSQYDALMVRGK